MRKWFCRFVMLSIIPITVSVFKPSVTWAQGLAVDFSTPVKVSGARGFSQLADIALGPSGNINIVWEDRAVECAMFARSMDGGMTFSQPLIMMPQIADISYGYCGVAGSNPGEVKAVCTAYDIFTGATEIVYTESSDEGASFSYPFLVSDIDYYNSYGAKIATGWTTAIIWNDNDFETGQTSIKYTQSVDGETMFTQPRVLNVSDGQVLGANVALGGEGLVYAVWGQNDAPFGDEDGWEIFFNRSSDRGVTFSTPVNISNYPQHSWDPRIALGGAKTVYVIWGEGKYGSDVKLLFTYSVDGGNSFSEPRVLVGPLPTLEPSPAIAVDRGGNVWVSWMTGDPVQQEFEYFITRSTDGGKTFAPAYPMPGGVEIAAGEQDVIHAVWNTTDQGIQRDVFYSKGLGRLPVDAKAHDDVATTQESQATVINVLSNDVGEGTLTLTSVGAPAHGMATIEGTAIIYTPGPHWNGVDMFSYTIQDVTGQTSYAMVTVTVAPIQMMQFFSFGPQDGWILESLENSGKAFFKNGNATDIRVGDDKRDRQYRGILSFNTSPLTDNATISEAKVSLKVKRTVGTDPFTTHGNLIGDIISGNFGRLADLQLADFNAKSGLHAGIEFFSISQDGWYTAFLSQEARKFINKQGFTQIRLRFEIDDDDDLASDYITICSGDSSLDLPVLEVR